MLGNVCIYLLICILNPIRSKKSQNVTNLNVEIIKLQKNKEKRLAGASAAISIKERCPKQTSCKRSKQSDICFYWLPNSKQTDA